MTIRPARLVLIAYVAFLVCLLALADSGYGRWFFDLVNRIPAGDKIGHFVLFGLLSFLVNRWLQAAEIRLPGIRILKGSAILIAIIALEECSQLFIPSRRFEWLDLAASILGILILGHVAGRSLRRKNKGAGPAAETARHLSPQRVTGGSSSPPLRNGAEGGSPPSEPKDDSARRACRP